MPYRGLAGLQKVLLTGHLQQRLGSAGGRQSQGRNRQHNSTGGPADSPVEAPGPQSGQRRADCQALCTTARPELWTKYRRVDTVCRRHAQRPVSKLLFHQPNAGWSPCVAPAEVPDDDTISHSPGAVSCCIPGNQLCCPGRALGGPVCCQNTCPAGHTADCCTADSIADVVATLYDAKSCGDVAMLLLLDVESAFDGLLHTVGEAAMDRLGISGYLRGFVTAFLMGRTFRVRVGRQLSEPRDIRVINICGSQRC